MMIVIHRSIKLIMNLIKKTQRKSFRDQAKISFTQEFNHKLNFSRVLRKPHKYRIKLGQEEKVDSII